MSATDDARCGKMCSTRESEGDLQRDRLTMTSTRRDEDARCAYSRDELGPKRSSPRDIRGTRAALCAK